MHGAVSPYLTDAGEIALAIASIVGACAIVWSKVFVPVRNGLHKIDRVFEVVQQLTPNGGESMFDRVERLDAGAASFRDSIAELNDRVSDLDSRIEHWQYRQEQQ